MNKRFLRWGALLLCLMLTMTFLCAMPSARVEAATSLSQLQSSLSNLKAEQQNIDSQLASLKKQASSQEAYRASLQQKIANAQQQLDNLKQQITSMDSDIDQKEQQIVATQSSIDADFAQLRERIKVLYMMGDVSMLEILLSANSVVDFLNRQEFVRAITLHDNNVMTGLQAQAESIQAEKTEIEAAKVSLESAKTDYDAQVSQMESAIAESKRLSAEIASQQTAAQMTQAQLAQKQAEVDAAITQWWKDYYAEQAKKQNANKVQSTGTFLWPLPGYSSRSNITQYFGGSNGHRGIDIAGGSVYGKPIVAADSGVVALTSTNNAIYGIYLTIDHGNSVATLYGHCSGLAVRQGATVKKGQVIAYVGESGIAQGAHLHFGVLINGTPVDPMKYFNIG